MKRRASQQLVPGGQNEIEDRGKDLKGTEDHEGLEGLEDLEDLDSTSQDTCNSDRKKFKAKRSAASEVKVEETSENFLKLLADLRDPDIVRKTNERNAKLEEQETENVTPRRVLPAVQNEFENIWTAQVKIRILAVCLGKGELQVLRFNEGGKFMVVFRNCIQKVLFSGVLFKYSKVEVLEKCKQGHEGKVDLGVRVLRQPEMKICSLALCGTEKEVLELKRVLESALESFRISDQGKEDQAETAKQAKDFPNKPDQHIESTGQPSKPPTPLPTEANSTPPQGDSS